MLKLNIAPYDLWERQGYLNTSHVKVKHCKLDECKETIKNLNTSHVKVKQSS